MSPRLRRAAQAALYEIFAIAFVGPVLSAVFHKAPTSTLLLAFVLSTIALVWNYVFNTLFERWEARQPSRGRSLARRVAHGIGFEGGLVVILVPVMASWLQISAQSAFVANLGLLAFFFVYAIAFTWAFDRVFGLPESASGERRVARRDGGSDAPGRTPLLGKLVLLCAALAAMVIVLTTVLGGAAFPDYSHASQFISELGAAGAPHADLVNVAGFLPAGILVIAFCGLAWLALPRSAGTTIGLLGIALFGLGYGVAAFYPCEPGCRPGVPSTSQTVHNVMGLAGYVTAPAALGLLGWQARRWVDGRPLAILAAVCAIASLVGLSLLSPKFAYVGLAQRLLEASVLTWMVACAFHVSRAGDT